MNEKLHIISKVIIKAKWGTNKPILGNQAKGKGEELKFLDRDDFMAMQVIAAKYSEGKLHP
jgi:hypothetical protein